MTSPESYTRPRRRIGVGAAVIVVILGLAVTVAIGILRGVATPAEEVAVEETSAAIEGAALYVHVSGAVVAPGLYRLRDGARVVDAVAAAGGFTDDADEAGVNLARPLADGEQIVVPQEGTMVSGGEEPGDGRVNLNTATAAELDTLPRIGPAMAERIIEWRDANGRFTSVEDLLAVPGIGDKMLETLRPLVTV